MTYSKGIQTSSMSTSTSDIEEEVSGDEVVGERRKKKKGGGGQGRETEDEMRKRILEEMEEERKPLEKELTELKSKTEQRSLPGEYIIPTILVIGLISEELSNEQRQAIFAAPDFSAFIEESTRIVQRALSDGYDYIKDYTVGIEGG